MSAPLADCCVRYIRHSMDCHIEWATEVRRLIGTDEDSFVGVGSYLCAMEGHDHEGGSLGLTLRDVFDIAEGRRSCPWHDNVPEDYMAAMRATGMPDDRT